MHNVQTAGVDAAAQNKNEALDRAALARGEVLDLATQTFRVPTIEDAVVDNVIIGSAPDSAGRADLVRNYQLRQRERPDPSLTPAGQAQAELPVRQVDSENKGFTSATSPAPAPLPMPDPATVDPKTPGEEAAREDAPIT